MSGEGENISRRDREILIRFTGQLQKDAHRYCNEIVDNSKGKVRLEAAWNMWAYTRMAMMELRLQRVEAVTFYEEPEHSVYQFNPEDTDKTKPKE